MNSLLYDKIERKVLKTLYEFTKISPMGSITTGMLHLLIKPHCQNETFIDILEEMENKGQLIGIPKGRTKRWRLD